MATPIEFPEQNTVLKAAPGTESWVRDLHIYRQGLSFTEDGQRMDQCVVSCWQLSPEELAEVQRTGVVYFQAFGVTHPPVSVWGTSPFRQPEPEATPEASANLFDNEGWHEVRTQAFATPADGIEVECQFKDHSGNLVTTRGFCGLDNVWSLPDVEGSWPVLRWRFKA